MLLLRKSQPEKRKRDVQADASNKKRRGQQEVEIKQQERVRLLLHELAMPALNDWTVFSLKMRLRALVGRKAKLPSTKHAILARILEVLEEKKLALEQATVTDSKHAE